MKYSYLCRRREGGKLGLGTIWLHFFFALVFLRLLRSFFLSKLFSGVYRHRRKTSEWKERANRQARGKRTRLYNDGREIDFRDEQHRQAYASSIEEKHLLSRTRGRACAHTRARVLSFLFLSLYSSSNGERVKGEGEREKRQKERRKRSNSSNSNGGKQATKRTLSLYFTLDEKIEQQG